MSTAAVLGVYLINAQSHSLRVGTLARDGQGAVVFTPNEAYLRDDRRPPLSLTWHAPQSPEDSRARLADRIDKIGLYGHLPPWFAGLLPEGALRDLVDHEMGPGNHDAFDVLLRLGADLPGGVFVTPDNDDAPESAGPIRWDQVAGFRAPVPEGVVKFSLAGVQLKLAVVEDDKKITLPARSGEGRYLVKLASDRYPMLPEAEYAGMSLAASIGVRTARFRLIASESVQDLPPALIHGPNALLVERFDRPLGGGRVHIEDMAQILGASLPDQKYTKGNSETILNMIRRFSTDWRDDVMEGFRRIVADVLIGNGDSHLKNWSFIFPAPGEVRLSPAYDIVPTIFYNPADELALRFAGVKRFEGIDLHRFHRAASLLGLDRKGVERAIARQVATAVRDWPLLVPTLPMTVARQESLLSRLERLPFVQEALSLA